MYEKQMSFFEDGGLKEEGGMIDEVSGNDVPTGSTRKEVRDDIPAMLSEGEFVFPADVVRYIGLDRLMQIRQEAKMGLKKMEAMGQMGNSDEATIPDDLPFGLADLVIIDAEEPRMDNELARGGMPMKFQEGGTTGSYKDVLQGVDTSFAKPAGGFTAVPTGQGFTLPAYTSGAKAAAPAQAGAITIKTFKNAQGIELPIPFSGNQPLYPIPYGFTETTAQTNAVQAAQTQPSKTTAEQRMSEAGPPDQAQMSTVPTPDEIAQMSAEELSDLAKSAQNMNVLGPALGIANPVLGIMGRVISKDYMSRVKDPIAKRAEELNIPNPLDKEEDKNIIDKIKSIFTKKDEEEEETKKDDKEEDKTKEAIPTVTPQEPTQDAGTPTASSTPDVPSEPEAPTGMTGTPDVPKGAKSEPLGFQPTPTTPTPTLDNLTETETPTMMTPSFPTISTTPTETDTAPQAPTVGPLGTGITPLGPQTAAQTRAAQMMNEAEERARDTQASVDPDTTTFSGEYTDDAGKQLSRDAIADVISQAAIDAQADQEAGMGLDPFGGAGPDVDTASTPDTPANTAENAPGVSVNIGGEDYEVGDQVGQVDPGLAAAAVAAEAQAEADNAAPAGPSDSGNASPDPGVAGAEVGAGPNGEDAEGPFNKGGFVKKKNKPKKAATTKPKRGLAARK